METTAARDRAGVALRTSAALRIKCKHDAEEHSKWLHADFSEALEPFGLPDGLCDQSGDSRWRVGEIAACVSYAGRLIIFNLAVVIIHLGVLRWVFLPIGG
jgi:hypothetical protein